MPSPFACLLAIDVDLEFAAHALGVWGPLLPQWQEKVRRVLHRVVHAFAAVREYFTTESLVSELTIRNPMVLAVFTVLLRWPDVTQPSRYLTGFKVVGSIEHSGMFHDIKPHLDSTRDSFLGEPAIQFLSNLLERKPSKDAQIIWDLTLEEQSKGWCEGPLSRFQADAQFGVGQWRPVPRFLHVQPCGKQRLIDDARKGCHNAATGMKETIFTIGVDMWPAVIRTMVSSTLSCHGFGEIPNGSLALSCLPPWFSVVASVMDLPDAYRGCPVHPEHRCFTIVVVFDPSSREWKFFKYTGLLYGLASAVLSFNRLPTLLVAAARRLLPLACGAYYDDIFDLSIRTNATVAQDSRLHLSEFT